VSLSRIKTTFDNLKQQGRAGLVTYTMAYDPTLAISASILDALPQAGADIIELGMPFSDPMADGPAIQIAGTRALQSGAKLAGILEIVTQFRKKNQHTPIILMGYINPVQHYGIERFAKDAARAGVDGLLIVDLPPEEDGALFNATKEQELALIKLVTPTTDVTRLKTILPRASGFLYYVTVAGVTGTRSASATSIQSAVTLFKEHTDLPIVAGFGIKTPEDISSLKHTADALVVGSAIVQRITNASAPEHSVSEVIELVQGLAGGLK
jgi:tryptophan synthase alpha chain